MASGLILKKVLVVDDDPVMLKTLTLALEPKGYEVFTAFDGPEAFAIVRRQKLDLILLDIFYPPDAFQSGNTWDGFLIIQWFQRMDEFQAGHIPVIVISGADPEKIRDRCLAVGAAAYLQKPIKIPELLDAIRQTSRTLAGHVPLELAAVSNSGRVSPSQTSGGFAHNALETNSSKKTVGHRFFDPEAL